MSSIFARPLAQSQVALADKGASILGFYVGLFAPADGTAQALLLVPDRDMRRFLPVIGLQPALELVVVDAEYAADSADIDVGDLCLHAVMRGNGVRPALAGRMVEDVVAALGSGRTLNAVLPQSLAEGAESSRHGRRRAACR